MKRFQTFEGTLCLVLVVHVADWNIINNIVQLRSDECTRTLLSRLFLLNAYHSIERSIVYPDSQEEILPDFRITFKSKPLKVKLVSRQRIAEPDLWPLSDAEGRYISRDPSRTSQRA